MSNLVEDFPEELEPDKAVIVVDPFLNVYQPRRESDGVVYVEKCLLRKGQYNFDYNVEKFLDPDTNEMIASTTHTNAYLVKETNFQDIGGGMQTFEKHYATFPTPWYEFVEVTYQTSHYGVINYRDKEGQGADWSKARTVLAKANHYYFQRKDIPLTRVPDTQNAGIDYLNDYQTDIFGNITKFNSHYNIAPQSRAGRNWETYVEGDDTLKTTVIAPDDIRPYMGNIYEFIRYTIQF